MNQARERAEEFFKNLQKRAREIMDADAGFKRRVKTFMDQKSITPGEARRRFDAAVKHLKAHSAAQGQRLRDMERRASDSLQRWFSALPSASKGALTDAGKQVKTLNKKFIALVHKTPHSNSDVN